MKKKTLFLLSALILSTGITTASISWNFSDSSEIEDYSGVIWDGIQDHSSGLQQGYQYGSLKEGLLAYYKMDEGSGQYANDSALMNDGVLGGSTSSESSDPSWNSSAKIGSHSLNFDGKDDYVDTGMKTKFGSDFTASFWVKTGNESFFRLTGDWDGSKPGWYVGTETTTNNEARAFVRDSEGDQIVLEGSKDIVDSTWHHVTMIKDGETLRLVVDGQNRYTATNANLNFSETSNNVYIGSSPSNDFPADASIDNYRLYDRALSFQEVKELYQQTSPQNISAEDTLQSGLVGWWPLHETNSSSAFDLSGKNHHGTLKGGVTQGVAGKSGLTAYSFDGSDDYVNNGNDPVLDASGGITISTWIKHSGSSSYQGIVSKGKVAGGAGTYDYNSYIRDSNTIDFVVGNNNGAITSPTTSKEIPTNKWTHLVFKWNGSVGSIYMNGVKEASESGTGDPTNDHNLYFGGDGGTTSRWLNGKLSDVRIYNRPISEKEIKALYRQGSKNYAHPSGNDSKGISNWDFNNDTDTSTAEDQWNGNDGTINGANYTENATEGKALKFDGSNDEVKFNDSNAPDLGSFTVSTWVKIDNIGDEVLTAVSKWNSTGSTTRSSNFIIDFENRDSVNAEKHGPRLTIGENNSDNAANVHAGGDVQEGSWMHITGTYDQSKLKIYVNGKLANSSTASIEPETSKNDILKIGNGIYDRNLDGKIDDVKIYNRSLSPHEVFELYQEGTRGRDMRQETRDQGLVGYWSLDEDSGSTAYDLSGQGNNGTTKKGVTQGATGVSGASAYNFDGADDYVSLGSNPYGDFNKGFTMSAWFKSESFGDSDNPSIMSLEGAAYLTEDAPNAGDLKLGLYDGSSTKTLSWSGASGSKWIHLVGRWDGSEMSMWANGSKVASQSFSGPVELDSLNRDGNIATGYGESTFFDGKIDNVRIYNRSLTASEIQSLYQSSKHSQIVTGNKSFSQGEKPNLENLAYNRDGGSMNISVLGYSTPEEKQVSLDGSSSFSLGWNNKHQKFQNVIDFSTPVNSAGTMDNLELSATPSSVSLSWTDNSNNEDGFRILQNASGSFQNVKEVGANVESATGTSSSLDSGEYVCYRVKAFNEYGASSPATGCITVP